MQRVNGVYTTEVPLGVISITPNPGRFRFYLLMWKMGPGPLPEFWVFDLQNESQVSVVEFKTMLLLDHSPVS